MHVEKMLHFTYLPPHESPRRAGVLLVIQLHLLSDTMLPFLSRALILSVAQLLAVGVTSPAPLRAQMPAACVPQPRPQDSLWLVSCRGLGCDAPQQHAKQLQYWRYDRQKAWVAASLQELVATDDPNVVTTVFVHGNRISWGEAFTKGWRAYRTLTRPADERPVRFVIWSWPSEAVRGPVNDARVKAWRTDPASFYLGWFLDQFDPLAPVSLWGHSFGARIITGALHLLGGGSVAAHRLEQRVHPTRQAMQVVLLAAALDNDWLFAGHTHGLAFSQVSNMLIVHNCADALLRRYRLIYANRGNQQALGYTGLASAWLPNLDRSKINQIEASGHVGKRHIFDGYIGSSYLVSRMRPVLLFETTRKPLPVSNEVAAIEEVAAEASER